MLWHCVRIADGPAAISKAWWDLGGIHRKVFSCNKVGQTQPLPFQMLGSVREIDSVAEYEQHVSWSFADKIVRVLEIELSKK